MKTKNETRIDWSEIDREIDKQAVSALVLEKPHRKRVRAICEIVALALALVLIALALSGCSTTNITKLTQALAKDPAIVVVNIGTVYGTVKFTRVGSVTNGMTVSPDGTVSVK